MKDSLMPLLRIVIAAAVAGALAMPSVASAQVVSEVRQQVEAQGRLHAEDQVDVHARGHAEIEARSEIQLCHATGSAEGDAFVLITIDESAVEAHLKHLDIHGRADIIPAPPGGCPTVEGEASVEADADANAHGSIHANMGADGSIDLGIGLGDHEMITICHATASAEGAAFVRIEIDRHALQAHLEQHGEGDIVLAAGDECPTASGGDRKSVV